MVELLVLLPNQQKGKMNWQYRLPSLAFATGVAGSRSSILAHPESEHDGTDGEELPIIILQCRAFHFQSIGRLFGQMGVMAVLVAVSFLQVPKLIPQSLSQRFVRDPTVRFFFFFVLAFAFHAARNFVAIRAMPPHVIASIRTTIPRLEIRTQASSGQESPLLQAAKGRGPRGLGDSSSALGDSRRSCGNGAASCLCLAPSLLIVFVDADDEGRLMLIIRPSISGTLSMTSLLLALPLELSMQRRRKDRGQNAYLWPHFS